jgi:hypothetical protein
LRAGSRLGADTVTSQRGARTAAANGSARSSACAATGPSMVTPSGAAIVSGWPCVATSTS